MSELWEKAGIEKDAVLIVSFYENIIKEMKDAYNSLYDLVIILKDKIDYIENPIELCISNENNMESDFEINYAHNKEKKMSNSIMDDMNYSDKKNNLYNTDKLNNILCKNVMSCFKNEKDEIVNPKNIGINNQKEFVFCEKKNEMINDVDNNLDIGYYSEGFEIGNIRKWKKKKKKNNNNSENTKRQQAHYVDEIKNIIDMNYNNKETIKNVKLLKDNTNDEASNVISSYNNLPSLGNIKRIGKKKKKNICPEYFSDLNFSDNSIDSNKIRILNLVNENKMLSKILNKKKKYYENIIFKNIKSGNNSEKNDYENLNPFFGKSFQNENKNKVTNIYNEQVKDVNIPYFKEINFNKFQNIVDQNKTFEKIENKHNDNTQECDSNLCRHYILQNNFKINYLENEESNKLNDKDNFCEGASIILDKEKCEKNIYTCNHQKNYLGNCYNNNINKEKDNKGNIFQRIKSNNNIQNKCIHTINNNVYKNILNCKLKNEQNCNECHSLFLRILKDCEKIKFIEMNKQNGNQKEANLNYIYNNQCNLDKNIICCNKCGEVYNSKYISYFDEHNESKTEIQKSVLLLNNDIYYGGNESSETVVIGNEENNDNLFETHNIANTSDVLKKSESFNPISNNIKYIPEYYYSNINNKIVLNKNVIIQKNGHIINDSNLVSCHCLLQKNHNSESQLLTNGHKGYASTSPEKCVKSGKSEKCKNGIWKVGGATKYKMDSEKNLYKIVSYKNVIKNTLPSNYIDVDVNPFRVPYQSIGSFLSYSNYMGKRKRRKIKKKN